MRIPNQRFVPTAEDWFKNYRNEYCESFFKLTVLCAAGDDADDAEQVRYRILAGGTGGALLFRDLPAREEAELLFREIPGFITRERLRRSYGFQTWQTAPEGL